MLKREPRVHLGDRIREVREKKGITLRTLAREAGVSESLISQIERNRVSPSIDTLLNVADILEIDMEYLFQDLRKQRQVSIVHRDNRNRIQLGDVNYQQLSIIQDDDEHAIEAFLLEISEGGEKGSREYGHSGKRDGLYYRRKR